MEPWNPLLFYSTEGSDLGKVYYLTVQESSVEAGQSQRRPGLHVDRPGQVKMKSESARDVTRGRDPITPTMVTAGAGDVLTQ